MPNRNPELRRRYGESWFQYWGESMDLRSPIVFLAGVLCVLGAATAPASAEPGCYRHQYLGGNPQDKQPGWHPDTNGISHDDTHWYIANVAGAPALGGDGFPRIWRIPVTRDLGHDVSCSTEGVSCLSFLQAEKRDSPGEFLTWIDIAPTGGLLRRGYGHVGDMTWQRVPRCKDTPEDCPGFLFTAIEGGGEPPAIAVFRYVEGSGIEFVDHLETTAFFWVGVGPDEGFLYTSERHEGKIDTPFLKYQIDWDLLENQLDLEFAECPGPWHIYTVDEEGNPLEVRNMQGGTFSDDGRLLYITNGNDSSDTAAGKGGIQVFEVAREDGTLCDSGPGDCIATRVDYSTPSSSGCSGSVPCAFVFEWHRSGHKAQEPQGITYFDLDAEGAPEPGGETSLHKPVGGQVHALMLDNNLDIREDQVFVKHYRAEDTCEHAVAGIDVFPDGVDFGDVEVGEIGSARVQISNLGTADLWVEKIELLEEGPGFSIASAPAQPVTIGPAEHVDVELEFAPVVEGFPTTSSSTATMTIQSDDPDEPLIEVALAGRGISLLDQALGLLESFDEGVALDELMGTGSGDSADHRRDALRAMLEEAARLLEDGFINETCGQLHAALMHVDGDPVPEDFVEGAAASALADDIQRLRAHLSCPIPGAGGCGLGFELVFLLPPLMWLRSRRRH